MKKNKEKKESKKKRKRNISKIFDNIKNKNITDILKSCLQDDK